MIMHIHYGCVMAIFLFLTWGNVSARDKLNQDIIEAYINELPFWSLKKENFIFISEISRLSWSCQFQYLYQIWVPGSKSAR